MFQAVRTENGVIVERDVRTYDTFHWIDARVRALSSFLGGDWGFEVIEK